MIKSLYNVHIERCDGREEREKLAKHAIHLQIITRNCAGGFKSTQAYLFKLAARGKSFQTSSAPGMLHLSELRTLLEQESCGSDRYFTMATPDEQIATATLYTPY